ncbi:MAG TPA: reverse transcriptase domain-containing protein [Pirellulaceae bacterium]|nr:reverse transcriptase domain-containing protein [Pirellulaceae bacterium]
MYQLKDILKYCAVAERRSQVIRELQLDQLPWQSPARCPSFHELTEPDYLHAIADYVRRVGGPGPGPDGVRLSECTKTELWKIARDLGHLLQEESFLPSAARRIRHKKPNGGYRELSLRSASTRVVSTALHFGFAPHFETVYLPCSYGFRRHIGPWHMLRDMVQAIEQGFNIVVQADVEKAFDNVRPDIVLRDLRRHPIEDRICAHKQHSRSNRL